LAPGGGGQHYGVIPDLYAMGKAMGNGIPISAIGGSRDIMQVFDEIFFSFTFGGDTLGIAASLKTIDILENNSGYQRLFESGNRLQNGLNTILKSHNLLGEIECKGLPHHTVVQINGGDEQENLIKKSFIQQESLKRGLLFLGIHFTSLSHTNEIIDETLDIYKEVFQEYSKAKSEGNLLNRLVGEPIKPVFRARV